MIELLILVSCSGIAFVVACLAALLFIRSKNSSDEEPDETPSKTTKTSVTTVTKINDGETYKLRRNDEYLAFDFDSKRAKGKMCNATTASSADGAATLKFTKDGDNWIVATDCDGDGNYTSYVTRGTDLIEAKSKTDPKKQRWSVECTDAGCAFKSAKDGKYLAGSFQKPSFTTNPVRFILA
jgi:hypothetical protein